MAVGDGGGGEWSGVGGLAMGGCWWRMVVVVRADCVWRWVMRVRTWWMGEDGAR